MPEAPGPTTRPIPPEPAWTNRGDPAFRRITAALFVAGLATFSLIYCVQPLLPIFADVFGTGAAASSLALSLTTGMLAVSIVVAGAVSDLVGRKVVMATSLLVAAGLGLLIALAPTWPLLLIGRTLEGIVLGGAPAVAMAYLAEEIHPRSLGFTMGLYVGGTAIGGMAGRVVTGLLAEAFGWRAALGGIGVLGLVAAIGFTVLLPPSRNFAPKAQMRLNPFDAALLVRFRRSGLFGLFLSGALLMGSFVTLYNYAGFRLQAPPYSLDQAQSGAVFMLYAIGTFASTAAGAAADRLGRAPVLAACVLLLVAGLLTTLAQPLPLLILGIGLFTVGFFGGHAVASGWVGRVAGPTKGTAAASYLLAYYLGSSLLGSIGGAFWSRGRWPAVAAFIGVLLAAQGAVTMRLWMKPPTVAP